MIAWLRGALRDRRDDRVVLDVGGVGYDVAVPIGVLGQTALGQTAELHVHTHVREDQIALFGFDSQLQKATFEALIAVSGIGPKVALNMLGGITPADLVAAVEQGDVARLKALHGVGKRLAERMTVELKGKLPDLGPSLPAAGRSGPVSLGGGTTQAFRDLASALGNLGYRPKEVEDVVGRLQTEMPDADLDGLIRAALQLFRK